MVDEELDDEIKKVSRQEVNDADIEAVRKALTKSAFNKLAQQELQLVKTYVDTKTKKKRDIRNTMMRLNLQKLINKQ